LARHTRPRAIFFDLADTLGYLWVPKHQRFLFLCNTAGVAAPSREAATKGTLAFLRTLAQEEPGPSAGSLGWRGSLASYAAGFKAMGFNDADALARDLGEVARSLQFVIFPDPAAEQVLGNLKAKGFRLGVISNHRGTLKENLEELALLHNFDVVLDSHLIGCRKPDSEIFLMACRAVDVEPEEAVHVGDEPASDIIGARNAGLFPVLVDPLSIFKPTGGGDVSIESLAQLEAVLPQ